MITEGARLMTEGKINVALIEVQAAMKKANKVVKFANDTRVEGRVALIYEARDIVNEAYDKLAVAVEEHREMREGINGEALPE